jgi:hypothetical protein
MYYLNGMSNQTIYDIVKKKLEQNTRFRNDPSDRQLIWAIWDEQGLITGTGIKKRDFVFNAASPKSIAKARREVQRQNPELRGNKRSETIKKQRAAQKGTFIFREEVKTKEDQRQLF